MDSQTTLDLIERARAGDQAAYDQLFALVADRARMFIRLRLGPGLKRKIEPDDLLQEAYIEAHRAFERFEHRGPGSFAKWVCRIIENQIRAQADHFGARKRTPPGQARPFTEAIDRARAQITGPATAYDRQEANARLADALEQLDEALRMPLLLRFFQERTIDEIADLMDRSPSAVRRLLGRATETLGSLLKACEHPEEP